MRPRVSNNPKMNFEKYSPPFAESDRKICINDLVDALDLSVHNHVFVASNRRCKGTSSLPNPVQSNKGDIGESAPPKFVAITS